jgi:hypothetical protein
MSNNQYGKRLEKRVASRARTVSRDVQRGMAWAGAELVRGGRTVGRDVKRGGKAIGRRGREIGSATSLGITRAGDRLRSRRHS